MAHQTQLSFRVHYDANHPSLNRVRKIESFIRATLDRAVVDYDWQKVVLHWHKERRTSERGRALALIPVTDISDTMVPVTIPSTYVDVYPSASTRRQLLNFKEVHDGVPWLLSDIVDRLGQTTLTGIQICNLEKRLRKSGWDLQGSYYISVAFTSSWVTISIRPTADASFVQEIGVALKNRLDAFKLRERCA